MYTLYLGLVGERGAVAGESLDMAGKGEASRNAPLDGIGVELTVGRGLDERGLVVELFESDTSNREDVALPLLAVAVAVVAVVAVVGIGGVSGIEINSSSLRLGARRSGDTDRLEIVEVGEVLGDMLLTLLAAEGEAALAKIPLVLLLAPFAPLVNPLP